MTDNGFTPVKGDKGHYQMPRLSPFSVTYDLVTWIVSYKIATPT